MIWRDEVKKLLQEIGAGKMTSVAYDTAWVARLHELDETLAKPALTWLRNNQLADGSWGAKEPLYHHDRVICTLSAIIALAGTGLEDQTRIQHALPALKKSLGMLSQDVAGETVAFPMLVPTLISEVKSLGLIHYKNASLLDSMSQSREIKLAKIPNGMISRHVTMAHSIEMAGQDSLHILDADNLQETNGSVGFSPAATAYFALYVDRQNPEALNYLRVIATKEGIPNVAPIDIVEVAWTLWNLAHIGLLDDELLILCQPHLDFLETNCQLKQGISYAAGSIAKDGDDTGLVFDVLTQFGRSVDLDAVLIFEEDDHFRCFSLEADASLSTNIHILGALRRAGLPKQHSSVQKILSFIRQQQTAQNYWLDKWHISPYYPTCHAIIATHDYADIFDFIEPAVNWLLSTQNSDGSWGFYQPTAEETAYCLQALAVWKQQGKSVPIKALQQGVTWLACHTEPPYLPLWIGKALYCPTKVIRATILTTLMLAENIDVYPEKIRQKQNVQSKTN